MSDTQARARADRENTIGTVLYFAGVLVLAVIAQAGAPGLAVILLGVWGWLRMQSDAEDRAELGHMIEARLSLIRADSTPSASKLAALESSILGHVGDRLDGLGQVVDAMQANAESASDTIHATRESLEAMRTKLEELEARLDEADPLEREPIAI